MLEYINEYVRCNNCGKLEYYANIVCIELMELGKDLCIKDKCFCSERCLDLYISKKLLEWGVGVYNEL